MNITYHGYYGAKNSGDDAFIEVASWGTEKYWKATEHTFFSAEAPKLLTDIKFFSPHKSYSSFLKSIFEIFKSDVFISAGGSTFHSALKKTDLRTYAKLKKSLNINGAIGAIGISLGPYANSEAENNTISYLKKLDFLALRDKYSYDIANSYNLPYKPVEAFDLAGMLPVIYKQSQNQVSGVTGKEKIIGISVCNYERYVRGADINKEIKRNKYIEELLTGLIGHKDLKFRFFIFNGNLKNGDEDITNYLITKLKERGLNNFEIIPYLADVKLTWTKVKECNLMISTRLHASIFACFADVPFFLVEYHKKCSDFLTDIGHKEKYRIYDGEKDVNEIISRINEIIFDGAYIFPVNKLGAEAKALRNFTETFKTA